MSTITCCKCKAEFSEMEHGRDQADGCSSEVIGDVVVGHYGSRVFDMSLGRFTPERPKDVTDGILCDTCITGMLEAGVLEVDLRVSRDGDLDDDEIRDILSAIDPESYYEVSDEALARINRAFSNGAYEEASG